MSRAFVYEAFVKAAASVCGVGYLKGAAGTAGSFVGLALVWLYPEGLFPMLVGLTAAGFLLCSPAERAFGKSDPNRFVLDETCGMMLALWALPQEWPVWGAAFLLFRILDAFKPWPIILIQRRKAPSSIMWDDLAAGWATNVLIQGALLIPARLVG